MTMPVISVVIPSHNRAASLMRLLEALEKQDLDPARFEVIVAMDAPVDDTPARVSARVWPMTVTAFVPEGRGASNARNAGAARARAARLLFLDDDVEPGPGCLSAHLRAAAAHPGAVVMAEYAPKVAATGWFYDDVRRYWRDHFAEAQTPGHRFSHYDLCSGNFSLDKATFDRVAGFDPVIKCREDYELGYRLMQAVVPFAFAPDAHAWHYDGSTPARGLARSRAEGVGDVQIARKHPELFRTLRVANLTSYSRSGRVLRAAVFRAPAVGRVCERVVGALLPMLERFGMRRWWQKGCGSMRLFSYYRAVAETLDDVHELYELAGLEAAAWAEPDILKVDLLDGLDAARALVDARRPDHLQIMVGTWQVTTLWGFRGAEPVKTAHLDRVLRDTVHQWAVHVSAAERLPPLPAVEPEGLTGVTPRREGGYAMGTLDLATWTLSGQNAPLSYPMRLLVRLGRMPLGWLILVAPPPGGGFWPYLRQKLLNDGALINRLQRAQTLPAPEVALPPISVVICTRDRAETLRRCLASVQALDYPQFEVIVVDNASTTDATRALVQSLPGIRYVREDRPGLDWARNRGIAEARHDIVAYTDDDTQVDASWLRGFAAAFAEPGVQAVTGLVVPMALDTAARVYFEDVYGGMGRGFTQWVRPGGKVSTRDKLWSSSCGVGANMAFRRRVFDRVGTFDTGLDVGTATRGGGDIEMFHRVMARGEGLAYAPDAFVWHEHRADYPALLRQLRDNGSGFAAYLMAAWRNRTVPRRSILAFAAKDWIWDWQVKRLLRPGRHRRDSVWAELGGLRASRRLYHQARADAAKLAAAPVRAETPMLAGRSVSAGAERAGAA